MVGVAEVFRNVSVQEGQTRRFQGAMIVVVAAGSVALFFALTHIFRDATGRVRHQGKSLDRSFAELAAAHHQSLETLAAALETRDRETEGHCERVTRYARQLGEALGLPDEALAGLERGALLHDIGKIGVPDAVLRKAGALDAHEWEQMRRRPVIGSEMVGRIHFLNEVLPVVRHHHERYDGTGYPDELAGEALAARIFAIADAFDAMTSDRPYRGASSVEVAREEIARCAGTQFDPRVVDAFLAIPTARIGEIQAETRVEEDGVALFRSEMAGAVGSLNSSDCAARRPSRRGKLRGGWPTLLRVLDVDKGADLAQRLPLLLLLDHVTRDPDADPSAKAHRVEHHRPV